MPREKTYVEKKIDHIEAQLKKVLAALKHDK